MTHDNTSTGNHEKMPGVVLSSQQMIHKPLKSVIKKKIFLLFAGLFTLSFDLYWEETDRLGLNVTGEAKSRFSRFSHKPRVVGYYVVQGVFESDTLFESGIRLDPDSVKPYSIRVKNSKRKMTDGENDVQARLMNSGDYDGRRAEPLEKGGCVALYDWQKTSNPTCNLLHEHSLREFFAIRNDRKDKAPTVRYLSHGGVRDVWWMRDYEQGGMVMKTLIQKRGNTRQYMERGLDQHRRDAAVLEHLTASPNVIDIYAFCGNSVINEYAPGDTLAAALGKRRGTMNSTELLLVAYQVAAAISDIHNVDREGQASLVHGDLKPRQFLEMNGIFKLDDFNYCHFVLWNQKENVSCPLTGPLRGRWQAPEYLADEPLTEKIDIFGMGNVFYQILTGRRPFDELDDSAVTAKVMQGKQPTVPQTLLRSNEPGHVALVKAIEMARKHYPQMRATARDIETYLRAELSKIGIHPG